MTISFRCEHCGKRVEAPDEVGGRRGRCPYCKGSNYIPAPKTGQEEELLDLAPEDEEALRKHQREIQALRETERALIAELGHREASAPPAVDQREDLKPEHLHPYIVNYCLALAGSNLEQANHHLEQLKKVRRMAKAEVERFLSGDILEPTLANIPPKVLHGFLNQLKGSLA